jgi:hypothetical protein
VVPNDGAGAVVATERGAGGAGGAGEAVGGAAGVIVDENLGGGNTSTTTVNRRRKKLKTSIGKQDGKDMRKFREQTLMQSTKRRGRCD